MLRRLLDPDTRVSLDDTHLWKEAEEMLLWLTSTSSLHQRKHGSGGINMLERVGNSIRVLDKMASSLPKDASSFHQSLLDGPIFWGHLPTNILNDTLLLWKRQLLSGQSKRNRGRRLLPSPSSMAQKVENYRWKCLVQPDATSFNLLLHAMVKTEGVAVADAYLRRLLQVAAKQYPLMEFTDQASDDVLSRKREKFRSSSTTKPSSMVDIVAVSTVMQGWADNGNPDRAQEWLDCMLDDKSNDETSNAISLLNVRPNTLAYTFVIHGWARQGQAHKAQAVLEQQLNAYWDCGGDDEELCPDRVLFHAVLDAWSTVKIPKERDRMAPLRARELIHQMEDTARKMENQQDHEAANAVRPDMETFGKLIAVYAQSNTRKYGPEAAKQLLSDIEEDRNEIAPIVVVNRILQRYTDSGRMDEAEDFLEKRVEQLDSMHAELTTSYYPDHVTLVLLLKGMVKKAQTNPEAPERAQETLDRFATEFGVRPSIQCYSIVLNAWSACVRQREDAAQRAEDLLRGEVLDLHYNHRQKNQKDVRQHRGGMIHTRHTRHNQVEDFTICVNIVLKSWALQASHHHQNTKDRARSQHAVERALQLLVEFLESPDATLETDDSMKSLLHGPKRRKSLSQVSAKPTDGTFRSVLHAILDSSISHKRERAEVIIDLMKRHRCQLNQTDLKRIQRLSHAISR